MGCKMCSMIEATEAPHPAAGKDIVLDVDGLNVAYRVRGRDREVLHSLSFKIARGESYGLVGESGCGKSTAALSVVRYLPENGRITNGRVSILGRDLYELNARELRHMRSHSIAMVYQDPGNALNPSLTVSRQIREVFELRGISGEAARSDALDALTRVRITDPARVLERYPHQLSGGMQQRVCIAMALASNRALLILDEPTTGLDATVEAEVLDLIRQLRAELEPRFCSSAIIWQSFRKCATASEFFMLARWRKKVPRIGSFRTRRIPTQLRSSNACRVEGSARIKAACERCRAFCRRQGKSSPVALLPNGARSATIVVDGTIRLSSITAAVAANATIPSESVKWLIRRSKSWSRRPAPCRKPS